MLQMLLYSSYIAYTVILIGSSLIASLLLDSDLGLALHARRIWHDDFSCQRCRMVAGLCHGDHPNRHGGKNLLGEDGIPWHFVCGRGDIHLCHVLQRTRRIAHVSTLHPASNTGNLGFYSRTDQRSHHQIWTDIRFTNDLPLAHSM